MIKSGIVGHLEDVSALPPFVGSTLDLEETIVEGFGRGIPGGDENNAFICFRVAKGAPEPLRFGAADERLLAAARAEGLSTLPVG